MKFDWKKAIITTTILGIGALITAFTKKVDQTPADSTTEFDHWLKSASDGELSDGYYQRWQKWAESGYGGNGIKTPEMNRISAEMSRRSAEKWKKNPNRNPGYHWTDENRWDKD